MKPLAVLAIKPHLAVEQADVPAGPWSLYCGTKNMTARSSIN